MTDDNGFTAERRRRRFGRIMVAVIALALLSISLLSEGRAVLRAYSALPNISW
jgi:hypothetical protein